MTREGGMNMNFLRMIWIPVFALVAGCSEDEVSNTGTTDPGHMTITMVDSPADYDAVYIDVIGVEAHQASSDSNSGWISIGSNPGIYDLITLRNGVEAVIADSSLPAGHYTQVRLLLGNSNTVVVDGVEYPLEVPSGSQSGLKLNHQFTIEPNTVYALMLDFDAEKSIVETGNGEYQLKPVIRLVPTQLSGSISGTVLPAESQSTASIVAGLDTISAYADTSSGYFKLMAVPAGTYSLMIVPTVTGYQDTTLDGVTVVAGQDTDVGTIVLSGPQ